MATEKILNTRIKLRHDTYDAWHLANPTLLKGEIAIVELPTDPTNKDHGVNPPATLIKVGPGSFNSLPFLSGLAADVHAWAKKSTVSYDGVKNKIVFSNGATDTSPISFDFDVVTPSELSTILAGYKAKTDKTFNETLTGAKVLSAIAQDADGDVTVATRDLIYADIGAASAAQGATADSAAAKLVGIDDGKTVKAYVDDAISGVVGGEVKVAQTAKDYDTADGTIQAKFGAVDGELAKKVKSVTAGNNSIEIGGTATEPTVVVNLSPDEDNAIALTADGLKVSLPNIPEYSITKEDNSGNYAAVYNLTKDGVKVGDSINIPKDMVVESGSVVENPEGQAAGTYIELKLQNVTEPLYINVGNLIEYVTSGSASGDMIVVNVSDDHKVTATITDGTITKAKLSNAVQTSLGKADTAIQSGDLGTMAKEAAADYVKKADATGYNDILTKTSAATLYQPVGNYQPAGAYALKTDIKDG